MTLAGWSYHNVLKLMTSQLFLHTITPKESCCMVFLSKVDETVALVGITLYNMDGCKHGTLGQDSFDNTVILASQTIPTKVNLLFWLVTRFGHSGGWWRRGQLVSILAQNTLMSTYSSQPWNQCQILQWMKQQYGAINALIQWLRDEL